MDSKMHAHPKVAQPRRLVVAGAPKPKPEPMAHPKTLAAKVKHLFTKETAR